jgi:predicted amidohydrolase
MPKVAAIQMCSSDIVDQNLNTAGSLLKQAADNGAVLAVLPEMFPLMTAKSETKISVSEKYGRGQIQDFLSDQSKKLNMWIVGGTIPIAADDPSKIRAASIVYNHKGLAVARYDKIHLFDAQLSDTEYYRESDTTEPGDQVVVVDTPVGKLGLSVCYDVRFPGMYTNMLNKGAEVIAIPSAFTAKTGENHWHVLTRSRAIENFCYVIGSNQGGTHSNGRKTYGHSLIVEPWGTIVDEIYGKSQGVVYANIDLDVLRKARTSIPIQAHQRACEVV